MAEEDKAAVATEAVKEVVEENFTEETPKETEVPEAIEKEVEEEETDLKEVESVRISHFNRSDIHSPYIRFGFPFFLLCTLVLLIVSDFSNGVDIKSYSDSTYYGPTPEEAAVAKPYRLNETPERLNMYTMTRDFWKDGLYAMSIMTAIFSIIWPFLKLISLFVLWFYPFDAKHPKKFHLDYIIQTLEQCGKWSLLEVYMLIIYIVMFSFRSYAEGLSTDSVYSDANGALLITFPPYRFTHDMVIFMDVLWGMSGFIMASCLALLASHFLLHKHRNVIFANNNFPDESVSFVKAQGLNAFLCGGFIVLTTALVVAGFFFKTVDVDYIESTHDNHTYYETESAVVPELGGAITIKRTVEMGPVHTFNQLDSSATFGINFSVVSEKPSSFATKFVQFVYFNMAIVFPIINHISLFLFCLVPLKREMREFLYTIGVSASAWCGYGVSLVAILMVMIDTDKVNDSLNDDCQTLCNNVDIKFTGYSAFFFLGYAFHIIINFYVSWYGYIHLFHEKE